MSGLKRKVGFKVDLKKACYTDYNKNRTFWKKKIPIIETKQHWMMFHLLQTSSDSFE